MNEKNLNDSYTDISLELTPHPINNDMSRLTGKMAIRTSVKNLVLAGSNERIKSNNKGAGLNTLLFESYSPVLDGVIERKISDVLSLYEPRVRLDEIIIDKGQIDQNTLKIEIRYIIQLTNERDTVTVQIERAR